MSTINSNPVCIYKVLYQLYVPRNHGVTIKPSESESVKNKKFSVYKYISVRLLNY